MRRWTVGRRVAVGYAVLLTLVILVAGVGMYALSTTRETYRSAIATDGRVERALEGTKAFSDAVREFRGFLLTGDDTYVEQSRQDVAVALRRITELRDESRTPELAARWDDILRTLERWRAAIEPVISAKKAGRDAAALRLNERTISFSRQENRRVRGLIQSEQRRAEEIANSASDRSSSAFWTVLVVAAIALVAGVAIALALARSITGRLRETIGTLASASAEILSATSQQAAGALEEETAVHETSATVDEVKQTVQVSTEKAGAVAESVRRTAAVSEDGRRAVEESIRGALEARTRMEAIAERILTLSEQAQAIAEITATVNELAEQSNLLAVNAGIEAAKAGEAGKGFAVVAAEVKALAEQSKQAATEIRRILGDVQQATQAAVMATEQGVKASESGETIAGQAGDAIHVLVENLTESAQAAQQIVASSQQQTTGMDQVALAMENIRQAAAQNMAATRQVEQAAQDLNELAGALGELVAASGNHRGRRAA